MNLLELSASYSPYKDIFPSYSLSSSVIFYLHNLYSSLLSELLSSESPPLLLLMLFIYLIKASPFALMRINPLLLNSTSNSFI